MREISLENVKDQPLVSGSESGGTNENLTSKTNRKNEKDTGWLRRLVRFLGFLKGKYKVQPTFEPQKDITAFELAELTPLFSGFQIRNLIKFSDSTLRHLKVEGHKLSAKRIQKLKEQGRM